MSGKLTSIINLKKIRPIPFFLISILYSAGCQNTTFAKLGEILTGGDSTTNASSATFDKTPPGVAISLPSATLAKNGDSITYDVTYSGAALINLTSADITLNKTGTANCTKAVTNGTTANPVVTLTSCTGDGTVNISIAAAKSSDTAGNVDAGAGPGTSFTVDNTAPVASVGTPSATLVNNAGSVDFTITYTGANTVNLTTVEVTLNTTGDASCSKLITNGTTATPTVTLSSCTGYGTVGITLTSASSDAAGNADAGSAASVTFTVDNAAPAIPNVLSLVTPATSPGNNPTPTIQVGGVVSGDLVKLFTDNGCTVMVGSGTSAGTTINIISSVLTEGSYIFYANSTDSLGNVSGCSTASVAYVLDLTLPIITSAETMDINNNGKIDHYKITFSKNVNDTTFPGYSANALGTVTTEWLVGSYSNIQISHGAAEAALGDAVNDTIIYLKFTEGPANDTGVKPDLTTTLSPGLQDTLGNSMAQVITTSITEIDRAKPVVISATGSGNTTAYITFSEPISAATGEAPLNYSIPGLSVTGAVMSNDGITQTPTVDQKFVILTTSAQAVGTNNYTATVNSFVTDPSNNPVSGTTGNSGTFSGQPTSFKVLSATATNNTTVTVTFNNNIGTGGTATTSYSISGLTVNNVAVLNNVATLTTASHLSNTLNGYTVVISSVQDIYGQTISSNPNDRATFTGDTLPHVVSAVSIDMNHVNVTFSEGVQWDTLTNGALRDTNYTIDNGLTINAGGAASFTPTTVVQLTTSDQAGGTLLYTLTVSVNVKDAQGNLIDTAGRTATFTGLENIKITSGVEVTPNGTTTYRIMTVTFSKNFMTGTTNNNAVDKTNAGYVHASGASALQNWSAPAGTAIIGVCASGSGYDSACPATGFSGGNTIYLAVDDGAATPAKPAQGSFTFVAAGWTGSALTVSGAAGCILPTGGVSATDCLQNNPNDRAAITFGAIPTNPGQGPVFSDPFNDGVTKAGQAFVYNGKLHIGPNATYTGVFETDINMTNSTTITLDADSVTGGNQAFTSPLVESSGGGCGGSNVLAGIDRVFAGCYSTNGAVDTTLTGATCSAAITAAGTTGGEYLFILGYNTSNTYTAGNPAVGCGYQSSWNSVSTTSPFIFNNHVAGLSSAGQYTFRAMSFAIFKGWLYQASQHQGAYAPRWNRFNPAGTTKVDLNNASGGWQNKIGAGGSIPNGQNGFLISIDVMHEYDDDGTGTNTSQLYIANGGSCVGCVCTAGDNSCAGTARTTVTKADGGVLRSVLGQSTSVGVAACTRAGSTGGGTPCDTVWQDVTPTNKAWLNFMSIALPKNAQAAGDWQYLLPANTITPAIKAIPKMANFNGNLYMIRNACRSETVENLSTSVHQTCAPGSEVPQLWKLPAGTTAAPTGAADWIFIGNITSGKTTMAGATWSDTVNQPAYTGNNTHITLLTINGNRLFIGFDNGVNGTNLWKTKAGVTNPASEADFEAVCDTGNSCSVATKQFGFGTIGDGNTTNDITRIFDAVTVNDAGTDYIVINAGDGLNPVKVYRANNN